MKEIWIERFGAPETLTMKETADPVPGPGSVRIRVAASGINFADIVARKGLYQDAPKRPFVPGYEVAGTVDAVGRDVSHELLGNRVFAMTRFGGYSDRVVVPTENLFEIPDGWTFEMAASLPVNYLTAWQLLVVMGSLSAQETVLIHNAGGGVGLAAIQIARHIGSRILGTASTHKHERLTAHGADAVFDYNRPGWADEITLYTEGKGIDLILDPIGGRNWNQNYKLLGATGRLACYGVSTVTKSRLPGPLRFLRLFRAPKFFHPLPLMLANKGVFGVHIGRLWAEQERVATWMIHLLEGAEQGWVVPQVDRVFPLERVADAHRYIEARKNVGKVILSSVTS